jgi:hypothetical protein
MDSKLDIWGLGESFLVRSSEMVSIYPIGDDAAGMILHKLLFFKLPYGETATYDELEVKIKTYHG